MLNFNDYNEYKKAQLKIDENLYDDAVEILYNLYKKNPYDERVIFKLVKSFDNLGKINQEITYFFKAKQILINLLKFDNNFVNVNVPFTLYKIGKMCREFGYYSESKRYLKKAYNLSDNHLVFEILFNLGQLEEENYNYDAAVNYFLELCLYENSEFYRFSLLHLMKIYIGKSDLDLAEKYYNLLTTTSFFDNDPNKLNKYKLFFDYMQNRTYDNVFASYSYFAKQLISYDYSNTLTHILLHSDNYKNSNKSLFFKEINIQILIEKVSNIIKNRKPRSSSTSDKYYVKFDDFIGLCGNIKTKTIIVMTLPKTKKIVSMYPVCNEFVRESDEQEFASDISLTESTKKYEHKRESQIEKFNRKYNIK